MRLFLSAFLLTSLFFTSLFAQETDEVEWTPGFYMRQATDNVFEKASLMNALSEYSWNENLCLAGALLTVGNTIALDVELEEGVSYSFIGGGDEDIRDLDLYIVDINEEVVAMDVEDDDTPIPDFVAPYTGRYSIRMSLISGDAMTSFVALALLREGGNTVGESDFTAVSDQFFQSGGQINSFSTGVKWHDAENQWCLFGILLDKETGWDISNMQLGSEEHYFFASAGEGVKNIDLILRTEDGQTISVDEEEDAYPILEITTQATTAYRLDVKNRKSKDRSLIMVGVLTE